jgi:hypothetical protein
LGRCEDSYTCHCPMMTAGGAGQGVASLKRTQSQVAAAHAQLHFFPPSSPRRCMWLRVATCSLRRLPRPARFTQNTTVQHIYLPQSGTQLSLATLVFPTAALMKSVQGGPCIIKLALQSWLTQATATGLAAATASAAGAASGAVSNLSMPQQTTAGCLVHSFACNQNEFDQPAAPARRSTMPRHHGAIHSTGTDILT